MNEKKLKSLLKRHGITPSTKIGQHFLICSSVVRQMVANTAGQTVVEIGAGPGQITEALVKKARKVYSVEIDTKFKPVLSSLARKHSNLKMRFGDILKIGLPEENDLVLVGSLPYHISEPLFKRLAKARFKSATFLVGRRLYEQAIAAPRKASRMTLVLKLFFEITLLSEVGKECFYPPPRVESVLIRVLPKSVIARSVTGGVLKAVLTASPGSILQSTIEGALRKYSARPTVGKRASRRQERRNMKQQLRNQVRRGSYASGNGKKQKVPKIQDLALSKAFLRQSIGSFGNNDYSKLYLALFRAFGDI